MGGPTRFTLIAAVASKPYPEVPSAGRDWRLFHSWNPIRFRGSVQPPCPLLSSSQCPCRSLGTMVKFGVTSVAWTLAASFCEGLGCSIWMSLYGRTDSCTFLFEGWIIIINHIEPQTKPVSQKCKAHEKQKSLHLVGAKKFEQDVKSNPVVFVWRNP